MKFEPLYLRVKEQLREDLQLAQASQGMERLPTLNALQAQYRVSRPTLSKALAALAAEGVLVKEPGRGTFALALATASALPPALSRTTIGYVAPLYGAELAQNVFSGIDRVAHRRNCRVLMAGSGDSVAHERTAAREMIAAGARGLILYPTLRHGHLQERDYLRTEDLGVPMVLVDTCTRDQGHTQVVFDNRRAGAAVTDWLLGQGRRRIGLVFYVEAAHHPGLEARYQGYLGALRERGLPADPSLVRRVKTDHIEARLGPILDHWLALPEPPDAIIASDDSVAMDLIELLLERGRRVPEDVLVTGFDNRVAARRFQPMFTTTAPDFEQLGETACETLLDGIESGSLPPQVYVLPAPLLVRGESIAAEERGQAAQIFTRSRGAK